MDMRNENEWLGPRGFRSEYKSRGTLVSILRAFMNNTHLLHRAFLNNFRHKLKFISLQNAARSELVAERRTEA
jgi:hypothetical protein